MNTTKLDTPAIFALTKHLAKELSIHTGEAWTAAQDNESKWNPWTHLCLDGKQRLWIQNSQDKTGSLHISCTQDRAETPAYGTSYLHDAARKEATTSINVAVSKGPQGIVKDIVRRILPSCLTLAAAANQDIENEKKRVAKEKEVVSQLLKAIGPSGSINHNGRSLHFSPKDKEGYGSIDVSVYSDTQVSVTLEIRSLSLPTALLTCEALKQALAKEPVS